MYSLRQDLSGSTISFDLVTLTLHFDLILKNFNICCYLVMVAAWRMSVSSTILIMKLHSNLYFYFHFIFGGGGRGRGSHLMSYCTLSRTVTLMLLYVIDFLCLTQIRCDSGVMEGSDISIYYDPMICKVWVNITIDRRDLKLFRLYLKRLL